MECGLWNAPQFPVALVREIQRTRHYLMFKKQLPCVLRFEQKRACRLQLRQGKSRSLLNGSDSTSK